MGDVPRFKMPPPDGPPAATSFEMFSSGSLLMGISDAASSAAPSLDIPAPMDFNAMLPQPEFLLPIPGLPAGIAPLDLGPLPQLPGLPPLEVESPLGLPPGYVLTGHPLENGVVPTPPPRPPPPEKKAPPEKPYVPPWEPPQGFGIDEASRKRRKVEGLAPSKNIKQAGGLTVYAGYSAITSSKDKDSGVADSTTSSSTARSGAAASAGAAITGVHGLPRQLPEGWEMKKSRSTGKVYYVNAKLGTSQFDPPAGSTVKVSAKKKQKASTRSKEGPSATMSDRNGVAGIIRATEQKTNKWAKWQNTSRLLNTEDEE